MGNFDAAMRECRRCPRCRGDTLQRGRVLATDGTYRIGWYCLLREWCGWASTWPEVLT